MSLLDMVSPARGGCSLEYSQSTMELALIDSDNECVRVITIEEVAEMLNDILRKRRAHTAQTTPLDAGHIVYDGRVYTPWIPHHYARPDVDGYVRVIRNQDINLDGHVVHAMYPRRVSDLNWQPIGSTAIRYYSPA